MKVYSAHNTSSISSSRPCCYSSRTTMSSMRPSPCRTSPSKGIIRSITLCAHIHALCTPSCGVSLRPHTSSILYIATTTMQTMHINPLSIGHSLHKNTAAHHHLSSIPIPIITPGLASSHPRITLKSIIYARKCLFSPTIIQHGHRLPRSHRKSVQTTLETSTDAVFA